MLSTDQTPISLDTVNQQPPQISLAPTDAGTPLPPEVAQDRAFKIMKGSAPLLEGQDQNSVYAGLINGQEPQLRQQAASALDTQNADAQQKQVVDAVNQGQPIPFLDNNPADPESIFEEQYGKYVYGNLDQAATQSDNLDGFWNFAKALMPDLMQQNGEQATRVVAQREYAINLKQKIDQQVENQGFISKAADFGLSMLQPYNEAVIRSQLDNGTQIAPLGDVMDEQRKELFRSPTFSVFKQRLDTIVNNIANHNPQLASYFLDKVIGQTTDAQSVDNIFSVMGVADLGTAAKLGAKAAKAAYSWNAVRLATRDVLAAVRGPATEENIIAATGDVGTAATTQEARRLTGRADPLKDILESVPSGLNQDVKDIKANPGRLGQGLANMLSESYQRFGDNLLNIMSTVSKVNRIPVEQASQEVLDKLKNGIKYAYPELSNSILDISNPVFDPFTNTHLYSIDVGRPGGILFGNPQQAQQFAKNLGLADGKVVRQGLGYYISITKPLRETDVLARDLLVDVPKGISPYMKRGPVGTIFKAPFDWIRTAEDTMAFNQRVNRKVASYAQAEIRTLADQERRYIQDIKNGSVSFDPVTGDPLPWYARKSRDWQPGTPGYQKGTRAMKNKNRWDDLERTLEFNQYAKDEAGNEGTFFKNPKELEDHYLRYFNRLPDQDEIQAYFAHKRLVELDRIYRNYAVYRNKTRVGTQTHTFYVTDAQGNRQVSPEFDGVRRTDFPRTDDTILMVSRTAGQSKVTRGEDISLRDLEDRKTKTGTVTKLGLRSQVKKGQKRLIEIYDPETNPLEGFEGVKSTDRPRYVLVDNLESKNIKWDQVPRRGGGHFEYEYNHYIKQARIRPENVGGKFTHWYEGDNTVMPVAVRSMGENIIEHLNASREMLDMGDEAGARTYWDAHPVGIDWDEFQGWFKGKAGNPARLSTSEPFVGVPRGKKIIDLNKDLEKRYERVVNGKVTTTFKDGTRQGSLARQFQVDYTAARDAHEMTTVDNVGSKDRPVYTISPAKKIDPIPMMNRALAKVINSSFMDDYKISAIEHWIRENAKLLKDDDGMLQHAPFHVFSHPDYKSGAPLGQRIAAEAARNKIQRFVGVPSAVDTFLHGLGQDLADYTYDKLGPKAALVPAWLLPRVTNPIQFARSMVYHAKLGLFALPQLAVQNMTYATMFSIAPKYTLQALPAVLFHQWSRMNSNPAILASLGKYAEHFGWKPGQWEEALREGNKTGFFHVGGEYINLDNASRYRLIRNAAGDFLDAGQVFFKEGEKNVRFGAWYTAFKEYRDAHPTGAITNAARNEIQERADLLYTNMSRASASTLHSGIFSLTTQFLSYQLRLSELFFSKRITQMQRARMALVYSGLYGIPAATGLAGYPFSENLRQYARDNGYVIGENFWSSLFTEGVPAMLLALATGKGDYQKGNWYNFGDRYGSQGFEQLRQLVRGDKPWWTIVGGATTSVLSNAIASADPFAKFVKAWWNGEKFPLKAEDFIGPLKEVQSVNGIWHVIAAHNLGMWMSKNGTPQMPTSVANAIFMSATGLSPQNVTEAYQKIAQKKDELAMQKSTLNEMEGYITRANQAYAEKDYSNGNDWMLRAKTAGVLAFGPDGNVDAFASAVARASAGNTKNLVDNVDWNFVFDNAPGARQKFEQRLDSYKKELQLKEKRGE